MYQATATGASAAGIQEDGEAGALFCWGLESILVGGFQLFDSLVDIGDSHPRIATDLPSPDNGTVEQTDSVPILVVDDTGVAVEADLHHQAAQLGAYVLCSNVSRLEVGHGLSRSNGLLQGRYLVGQLGGVELMVISTLIA